MLRVLTSPRMLGLHVLATVAVVAALLLGLWQYDAWQARRAAEADDLADSVPVPLRTVMSADDPFPGDAVGQPVRLTGAFVPGATFLVEGRQHEGRTGFWVVTPLAVCDGACSDPTSVPAMLVVRGWTAEPDGVPPAPAETVRLTGWLQPPEGSGRPDPDPGDDVLPELRIADAIQRVDQDLYGGYVIARTGTGEGSALEQALAPVTPGSLPEPETFTALRNLLYALEWWVFGAFAAFVWWRWVTDEVERERAGAAEVPSSP